jgi:hypothetical protein
VKIDLDHLASLVITAKEARRKAAEARIPIDPADPAYDLATECSEAARWAYENALRVFFEAWISERLDLERAAHAAHEAIDKHVVKARGMMRAT